MMNGEFTTDFVIVIIERSDCLGRINFGYYRTLMMTPSFWRVEWSLGKGGVDSVRVETSTVWVSAARVETNEFSYWSHSKRSFFYQSRHKMDNSTQNPQQEIFLTNPNYLKQTNKLNYSMLCALFGTVQALLPLYLAVYLIFFLCQSWKTHETNFTHIQIHSQLVHRTSNTASKCVAHGWCTEHSSGEITINLFNLFGRCLCECSWAALCVDVRIYVMTKKRERKINLIIAMTILCIVTICGRCMASPTRRHRWIENEIGYMRGTGTGMDETTVCVYEVWWNMVVNHQQNYESFVDLMKTVFTISTALWLLLLSLSHSPSLPPSLPRC